MAKYILAISLAALFSFSMPAKTMASTAIEIIENDIQPNGDSVSISIEGTAVRVTGANGQVLYVYNVAGVRIQSVKVEGSDKHLDLNLKKGCYILKVGKTVRKVSLK